MTRALLALLSLLALAARPAHADPPDLVPLQMRLAHADGTPLVGPVSFEVRLYDVPAGGAPLWSESHAATALNGVVTVMLGASTPFPASAFEGGERWLALEVAGDGEMLPRRRVGSVPYAERAKTVEAVELADGSVDAAALAPDSVDGSKVVNGSIGASELAAGAVTGTHLASDSVSSAELAAGAVSAAKIADGAVGSAKLGDAAVSTAKLADAAVTAAKLAPGALSGASIADGSITAADLAPGSVGAAALVDAAVDAAKIALDAVGSTHIADGAVTAADLAADAVTGAAVAADSLGAAHLAEGSVGASEIADGAVRVEELAVGAVTSAAVADGAIATADLADKAVNGDKLAPSAVHAVHVADLSIGTVDLADLAVTAAKLADGAVTAAKIGPDQVNKTHVGASQIAGSHVADGTLTALDLAAGAVGSEELAAGAVTSLGLATDAVTAAAIAANAVGASEIATSAVGSTEIANGSIVDADVSGSASIEGSKIVPVFVDPVAAMKGLGVGTSTPSDLVHVATTGGARIRVEADTDNSDETHQAAIELSQDGGLTVGRIGFSGGTDDLEMIHQGPFDLHLGTAGLRRLTVNGSGGWLGVNVTEPLATIHAVGAPNLGSLLVAPNEPASGDDSQLVLAEEDDGTFGMKLHFDGASNDFAVYGVASGADVGPHLSVDRDSGLTTIPGELRAGPGATGTPVAYGSVSFGGQKLGGSDNWSVAFEAPTMQYRITLSGVSDFSLQNYAVVLTSWSGTPYVSSLLDLGTGSFGTTWWLLPTIVAVQEDFSFVVYRY